MAFGEAMESAWQCPTGPATLHQNAPNLDTQIVPSFWRCFPTFTMDSATSSYDKPLRHCWLVMNPSKKITMTLGSGWAGTASPQRKDQLWNECPWWICPMKISWSYFTPISTRTMRPLAFWVCQCLFPSETAQYPQKLLKNAWHLAENPDGLVGGFSGTDDNHRALPLQVTQEMLGCSEHKRWSGSMSFLSHFHVKSASKSK